MESRAKRWRGEKKDGMKEYGGEEKNKWARLRGPKSPQIIEVLEREKREN